MRNRALQNLKGQGIIIYSSSIANYKHIHWKGIIKGFINGIFKYIFLTTRISKIKLNLLKTRRHADVSEKNKCISGVRS